MKGSRKFRKQTGLDNSEVTDSGGRVEQSSADKLKHHSGILGLCAFVEAFPYDVPSFVPPILMELSTHLNDPQVFFCLANLYSY